MKQQNYTICIQDRWTSGLDYRTFANNLIFTYNNKIYAPQNVGVGAGDQQVYTVFL